MLVAAGGQVVEKALPVGRCGAEIAPLLGRETEIPERIRLVGVDFLNFVHDIKKILWQHVTLDAVGEAFGEGQQEIEIAGHGLVRACES